MSKSEAGRGGDDILREAYDLSFTYTRSLGPVIGRCLQGLREGKILGARGSDGRVIVPAPEYDPDTAEALSEFVEVGEAGEVVTWSWVEHPHDKHHLGKPFAWALIKLDGADTSLLHAVEVDDAAAMSCGMRVRADWAAERRGHITDIRCFKPE